jgi:23S rRNA pseudouridine2605 synthase
MKTRLQRFMADCGIASRRECEALIQQGRVRVNGETRAQMPVLIDPEKDIVTVDGATVGAEAAGGGGGGALQEQDKVYYLLNKPKGILVTNYDPARRKTVGELMTGVKERVFPVGRLDMDSRGALLMTNDGELANRLTHPRYGVEKTYVVEVDGRVGPADIEKVKRGVWLGPENPRGHGAEKTERFHVKLLGRERGRTIMEVRLSESKNREIRRVMARIGHVVRDLNRVAIAGKITTRNLEPGKFRPLTPPEVKWLYHAASPEFHDRRKIATQEWYEQKEMAKERKRLAAEAEKTPPVRGPKPATPAPRREFEERPLRPERKGRKPFVPPTGRNAGRMLGGNYLGRKRLESQQRREEFRERRDTPASAPEAAPPQGLPRSTHPLGDAAKSED